MKSAIRNPHLKLRTSHYALRTGFTLVELLIVIVIIVVLAAIGVGVGYKFSQAADIEQTKANITLIMNAVKDYYDQNGAYPAQADDEDYRICVPRLDSSGTATLASYERFVSKLKEAGDIVFGPITFDGSDAIFTLADPEGRPIRYVRGGGIGGTPLLVAPGEDGLYGMDGDDKDERDAMGKDDIRSDK